MQVFLSSSFRPEDAEVVRFIRTICEALGLHCVTVDTAAASVPPVEARRLIKQCDGVIAIATRRDRLSDTEYAMPPAVREEVAIACGVETPVLPLLEEGVRIDGMFGNFATCHTFDRGRLAAPETFGKIIRAVSAFRDVIQPAASSLDPPRGFYSEQTRRLLSLEGTAGAYTWRNVTTKRLRFDDFFTGRLMKRSRAGYDLPPDAASAPMRFEVTVDGGSQSFEMTPTVLAVTGSTLDLELSLEPPPAPGDWLEFTTRIESPDLNPIYADRPLQRMIRIDERNYAVTDGIVLIEQTRLLVQQWHFPAGYGLRVNDIKPFASTYSFGVDSVSKEEARRAKVTTRAFPDTIVIDMEVHNPRIRHMYGMAWNPPSRAPGA